MADQTPLPFHGPFIPRYVQRFGWPLPPVKGAQEPDGEGEGGDGAKTVPQSEVDRIVKDRLARERAKFADYDDLKAKAARADELEAAGQTELERLQAQVKTLEQERDAAKADADTARSDAQNLKVEAEIRKALPQDVVDPDVFLKLLPRDQVTVGDDGQVTGHEDAIKALSEAHPFLVGTSTQRTAPGPRDGGARGPAAPNADDVSAGTARVAAAYGQSTPT
jgi:hypothetical protein